MSSFLLPAYWGSFFALMIGVALNLVFQLRRGDRASDFSHFPAELAVTFSVIAALISIILALRYYAAVTLNLYTSNEQSTFSLPHPLRLIVFSMLVVLLLLCNLSVALYGSLGPIAVMYLGPVISVTSLACLVIMWIARIFRPHEFGGPERSFMVTEAMHLIALTLLLFAGALGSDSPNERAFLAGVVGAFLLVVFLHEIYKVYYSKIAHQLSELRDSMVQ